jgi:hypothetical protein
MFRNTYNIPNIKLQYIRIFQEINKNMFNMKGENI